MAVQVTIVPAGDWGIPVELDRLPDQFMKDLARLILAWATRIQRAAQKDVPIDQGQLRASIRTRLVQRAAELLGIVGTNAPQAMWVEFGTGIYSTWPGAPKTRITAKNGKCLLIPIGTLDTRERSRGLVVVKQRSKYLQRGYIFRRSIAGMKPRPFLTPQLEKIAPEFEASVRRLAARHGFT